MKKRLLIILLILLISVSACNQQIPSTNYIEPQDTSQETSQRRHNKVLGVE